MAKVNKIDFPNLREYVLNQDGCSLELKKEVVSMAYKIDTKSINDETFIEKNAVVFEYLNNYLKFGILYETLIGNVFKYESMYSIDGVRKVPLKDDKEISFDDICYFVGSDADDKDRTYKVLSYLCRVEDASSVKENTYLLILNELISHLKYDRLFTLIKFHGFRFETGSFLND